MGGVKQAAGAFLAVYIVAEIGTATTVEPVQQFSTTFLLATGVSWAAYFEAFGSGAKSFSPLIALVIALVATPVIALATKGKYYLRRPDLQPEARFTPDGTPTTITLDCAVCHLDCERPDMVDCAFHEARLCSLCCTTEQNCKTVCHESQTFLGLLAGAPANPPVPASRGYPASGHTSRPPLCTVNRFRARMGRGSGRCSVGAR